MTRPRFVKADPTGRELTRYHLIVHRDGSDLIIGAVISKRWGRRRPNWFAERNGRLLMQPRPSEDPMLFTSQKQAGNALILNWQKEQENAER